jgi:hypothetical protein
MSRMIVLCGEISRSKDNSSKGSNHSSRRHNKDDTLNVAKAVVRKSILMQITRAKAANGFH